MTHQRSNRPEKNPGAATSTTTFAIPNSTRRGDIDADIALAQQSDLVRARDAINRVLAKLDGP